jgi:uncharacterized membrane protein YidH (DUF202 family)
MERAMDDDGFRLEWIDIWPWLAVGLMVLGLWVLLLVALP